MSNLPIKRWMVRSKSWRALVPSLLFMLLMFVMPGLSQAQPPYNDFPLQIIQTYTGNVAVETSGVSFFSGVTSNSFNITIPVCPDTSTPTINGAFMNYYTRWREADSAPQPTFDNTLDVTIGAGSQTAVTDATPYVAKVDGGPSRNYWRNHGIVDITAQFANDFTAGVATTIDIQNFDLPTPLGDDQASYGVGLSVVYSCADYAPATANIFGGLDFFYSEQPDDPIGDYSDLFCVSYAAAATDRTATIDGIVGGQANAVSPFRGNRLWYITGTASDPIPDETATPPAGIVANDAAVIEIGAPNSIWTSNLGQEWDRVDETINIPANSTWACLQSESVQNGLSDVGISGDLLAPIITIPTATTEQVAIGNFIWEDDVTANGAFDTGESPIDGVTVQLYTSTQTPGVDTPTASTTTTGGFYLFDNLTPGSYIVHIPSSNFSGVLSGYATCTGAGGDNTNDDNVDENGLDTPVNGGISSPTIGLAADGEPTGEAGQGSYTGSLDDNNVNMTVDFCFTQTPPEQVAIGNFIWEDDVTANGAFDTGETPLDGVTVQLYTSTQTPGVDTPVASTTTTGGGFYLFDNLTPGNYVVHVPAANFSGALSGYSTCTGGGGDIASDDNLDENGQDIPVNGGISSTTIGLAANGEPTGEAGQGSYTGSLDDNNVNMTVDFCFTQAPPEQVAIGNFIWADDVTSNGAFDTGETPLNGVTVQLYTSTQTPGVDTPVATTTTAGGGFYLFDNLTPGNYVVHLPAANFTGALSGYSTCGGAGSDNANDDNVDENGLDTPVNGGISSTTIGLAANGEPTGEAGQGSYSGSLDDNNVNMTVDFCFTQEQVAIGNFIWADNVTSNGSFDAGETPLDGVAVQLYQSGQTTGVDTPVASTTTAGGGFYLFDNLAPGTYVVYIPASNFSGVLSGYASCGGAGGDTANDDNSDENGLDTPVNGGTSSGAISVLPDTEPTGEGGQGSYGGSLDDDNVNMTVDFCYTQQRVAIGNFIWADSGTSNGVFDTGETPLDGVTVQLYTSTQTPGVDTPVASTTSAGGGFYLFDNLAPGSYVVHLPASNLSGVLSGYASCTGAGGDNANDDNADENGQDVLDNGGISSGVIGVLPDTEPTGEAGQGSYSGSLDDDNVNMTIDFCLMVGVPITPTPPTPGQPSIADPAIVKLVNPAFAQPNETVVWTITVTNPTDSTLANVSFTDQVDDRLEILGTSTTDGTVFAAGQTVTFSIASLAPNEIVTITVTTRVRSTADVPFIIDNTAILSNPYTGSSSARITSVQSLPSTGETPAWRAPLMMILVISAGAGITILLHR